MIKKNETIHLIEFNSVKIRFNFYCLCGKSEQLHTHLIQKATNLTRNDKMDEVFLNPSNILYHAQQKHKY